MGGRLKTPAEADEESIQGGWFTANTRRLPREVELRGDDFLPLVELAAKWYRQPQSPFTGLPAQVGHASTSLRLVIVLEDRSEDVYKFAAGNVNVITMMFKLGL